MAAYLLRLSTLNLAAPGVLDVIFGPDGDFDGAPSWAGPMTSLADPSRRSWLVWRGALHVSVATADGHWSSTVEQWRERWALDLRITSVADRLRRLCERALGGALYEMDEFGGTKLTCGDEILACWASDGTPTSPLGAEEVRFPAIGGDWLGPLVITLAPKIAALKTST